LSSHRLYLSMLRTPPLPTLFPYTTLFRSAARRRATDADLRDDLDARRVRPAVAAANAPPWTRLALRCVPDPGGAGAAADRNRSRDRKSTRLNSSHRTISYAVFCLKKKKEN